MPGCGHVFCPDCILPYVTSKINDAQVAADASHGPAFPTQCTRSYTLIPLAFRLLIIPRLNSERACTACAQVVGLHCPHDDSEAGPCTTLIDKPVPMQGAKPIALP